MDFRPLLFIQVIAFAAGFSITDYPNGFKMLDIDPATIQLSTISMEEANDLFKEYLKHKEIPFKYPIDGCYARAHAMSKIAEEKHIITGKVFAMGELVVKTESSMYPIVTWGWHVAPVVAVRKLKWTAGPHNTPIYETIPMVLDPSLCKSPVTVEEWKKLMLTEESKYRKGRVDRIYYGARYQYRPHESNKIAWVQNDLDHTQETFNRYRQYEDRVVSSPSENFPESRRGR